MSKKVSLQNPNRHGPPSFDTDWSEHRPRSCGGTGEVLRGGRVLFSLPASSGCTITARMFGVRFARVTLLLPAFVCVLVALHAAQEGDRHSIV